jgi:CubicO group peptidase (beta-lactamase class C family)
VAELLPLPAQPADVPWPTPDPAGWPAGSASSAVESLVDAIFGDTARYGDTYAVVVVQGGRLLTERYGGALPHFDQPPTPVEIDTPLLSWSMAKSMLHALVGMAVVDGLLDIDAPTGLAAWADDERSAITLRHLLAMRDGLRWAEDYVDVGVSDVIEMLFGSGADDMAAYAIAKPAAAAPDTVFNYSSGTSNIVSHILGRVTPVRPLLARLFDAIGMTSATARFDAAGTFAGSSYVYATARDYARFGLLYLRGGTWDGSVVVPPSWVDHARTWVSTDAESGDGYGAHWWLDDDGRGTFRCAGYEGQSIVCCPASDAVVVRLGRTLEEQKEPLIAWRAAMLDALT